MTPERPNPDELLAKVERDQAKAKRGRLKIFFGFAAGVGKTYAMLLAARERRTENVTSGRTGRNPWAQRNGRTARGIGGIAAQAD